MSALYDILDNYIDEDEEQEELEPQLVQEEHKQPTSTRTMSSNSLSSNSSSLLQESFKHSLLCSHTNKRLSILSNASDPQVDELIDELNTVNIGLLTKKEKKELISKNSKYYVNFSRAEFTTKSANFGNDWHKAYKAMIQSDWERIKFLSKKSS